MTTLPTVTLVSACAVDPHCPGDMYRTALAGLLIYCCTAHPDHIVLPEDLARCTRCSEAQASDRYTVSRALRDEGWALIGGKLVCSEHPGPCPWCEKPMLLDGALCADGRTLHPCGDCAGDEYLCDPCQRDAADDQAYALARDDGLR